MRNDKRNHKPSGKSEKKNPEVQVIDPKSSIHYSGNKLTYQCLC